MGHCRRGSNFLCTALLAFYAYTNFDLDLRAPLSPVLKTSQPFLVPFLKHIFI